MRADSEPAPAAAAGVARNSVYGLLALGVDKAVFMVVTLVLARHLGPAEFGRYAFVVTWISLFQIIADLGLEMVLVRHIAQRPEDRDHLFGSGLALRLTSGAICWLLAVPLVPLLSDLSYVPITAVGGASLVGTAALAFRVLYRVSHRIDYLLAHMAFNAVATAALVAVAVFGDGAAGAALAAGAGGSLLTLGFAFWLGHRLSRFRPTWEPQQWLLLVRESLPLGVNAVLVSLAFRIGPLVLLRLGGTEDVAYFTAASKVVESLCLIPEVPMLTIFPLLSAMRLENEERFRGVSRAALVWIVLLTLPVIIIVGGVAPTVLTLMYGPLFAGAVPVLEILVWATAFAATGAVWMGVLTALHEQRWLLRSYAVATAVNFVGALLLVPRWGSVGAAASSVLGALAAQVLIASLPHTARYTRAGLFAVLPVMLASFAAVRLGRAYLASPLLATALALAVYAVAARVSGALGPEERAFARRLLRR